MCLRCDTTALLGEAGLAETENRRVVLDLVSRASEPLSAPDIVRQLESAPASAAMNKVTVYRILDLLAERGLLNRLAAPDRMERYCLAENANHPAHAHFFCTRCGRMRCLAPACVRPAAVEALLAGDVLGCGRVDSVQVLLEGVCAACLSDPSAS